MPSNIEQNSKRRWPKWYQWRRLPSLLEPRELYTVWAAIIIILFSALSWLFFDRIYNYTNAPEAGGEYREALIGQPRFINPILSESNDVDRDLTSIIYSGLMKYTPSGSIEPDLAESYEVEEEGLVYIVRLRDEVSWHDGRPLRADDIIFTVNAAQNPDYKSPVRTNWQNARIEKIDDRTVRFILNQPSTSFIETMTLGIMPSHIWSNISVRNFALAEPNLTPIGTGPYKFSNLSKDGTGFVRSLQLEVNDDYYDEKPYIKNLVFNFYETENEAIAAWNNGEVMGLSFFNLKNLKFLQRQTEANFHKITLPRFVGVFFNQTQHKALADKNVRLALRYATDKRSIIRETLGNNAT
ncbi:hypothetical protein C4553_03465, partial [Candidatus Parcubacteria bacterium]